MTETTKYMCSTVRTRGSSVCKNALKVPRTLVESRLLHAIQRDLFTEEGLAVFKDEVTRLLAERQRKQKPEQACTTWRNATVWPTIPNGPTLSFGI